MRGLGDSAGRQKAVGVLIMKAGRRKTKRELAAIQTGTNKTTK